MSTNETLSGSSGGGGGGGGGEATTNTSSTGSGGLVRFTPSELRVLGALVAAAGALLSIVNDPLGFILGGLRSLFGNTTLALLRDPVGFIFETIRFYIYDQLLLPLVEGTLSVVADILAAFTLLFVGSNGRVGLEENGTAGIFDLPWFAYRLIDPAVSAGEFALFSLVRGYGDFLLTLSEPLGPFAFPVAAVGVVGSGAVAVYGGWLLIQVVPFTRIPVAAVRVVLFPFRAIGRWAGFL